MKGIIEHTSDGCKGFIDVNELAAVINGAEGVNLVFKGGVVYNVRFGRAEDAQNLCETIVNTLHYLKGE